MPLSLPFSLCTVLYLFLTETYRYEVWSSYQRFTYQRTWSACHELFHFIFPAARIQCLIIWYKKNKCWVQSFIDSVVLHLVINWDLCSLHKILDLKLHLLKRRFEAQEVGCFQPATWVFSFSKSQRWKITGTVLYYLLQNI